MVDPDVQRTVQLDINLLVPSQARIRILEVLNPDGENFCVKEVDDETMVE